MVMMKKMMIDCENDVNNDSDDDNYDDDDDDDEMNILSVHRNDV